MGGVRVRGTIGRRDEAVDSLYLPNNRSNGWVGWFRGKVWLTNGFLENKFGGTVNDAGDFEVTTFEIGFVVK